jgi:N utilization substance protein B
MPQLPKTEQKLSKLEITDLVDKAVHLLVDYARQNLKDAQAVINGAQRELEAIELEHPDNSETIQDLVPVTLTTGELREKIQQMETTINLVSEALDIPQLALSANSKRDSHGNKEDVRDFFMRLITTYLDHKETVDEFIKRAKTQWSMERMVSIDRDILRLACTEAFYMDDIPINVAISEAVELSHRFADERAAKFINGVMASLTEEALAVRRMAARKKAAHFLQQQQ